MLSDSVRVSKENALSKSDAVYSYIESLNKSFIIEAGQNCFVKESNFGREPIRRLTTCIVKSNFFRGLTIECTPFRYTKFSLSKVEIQRGIGVPIAGTPIRTTNAHVVFATPLGFEWETLTLFPELTGVGLTLKLDFSETLTEPVELFLVGEQFSHVLIDSGRNIRKICRSK